MRRPLMAYDPPQTPVFEVVYKDEHLIVFNKPSELLTVPGKHAVHKDSLQLRVQRVWPSATIVHRLDMATSGLLIMALDKPSHRHISKQFETRQVGKTYYARVLGLPPQTSGTIELPLVCDWPNRPMQMVDWENGKPACTHWELVSSDEVSSLLKLTPITGRSHQLRVHMLSMGHAILGDRLYASDEGKALSSRLCLHAFNISFMHPVTGNALYFETPYLF
ncbi:RNA pseudouridine synthase [Glaciecola punicea]|nr:RNA pseudouridine synthase [Glaciecola punicea]